MICIVLALIQLCLSCDSFIYQTGEVDFEINKTESFKNVNLYFLPLTIFSGGYYFDCDIIEYKIKQFNNTDPILFNIITDLPNNIHTCSAGCDFIIKCEDIKGDSYMKISIVNSSDLNDSNTEFNMQITARYPNCKFDLVWLLIIIPAGIIFTVLIIMLIIICLPKNTDTVVLAAVAKADDIVKNTVDKAREVKKSSDDYIVL